MVFRLVGLTIRHTNKPMSRTTHIMRRRIARRAKRSSPIARLLKWGSGCLGLLASGALFATLATLVGVYASYAYFTRNLPNYTEIETLGQDTETFETTKIYAWQPNQQGARDAVLIYEVIDPLGGDRQWLDYQQIPQNIIDATVAIEDKSFWSNRGFDAEGIGRAFYEYVLQGGAIQGGSSITQQLVKNNLIEPERRVVGAEIGFDDYQRKVEELLLAQEMSRVYSKEQILEWYLNSNFYGNLAYGIEAASRVYYDKPAAQLSLAESAMLAAIPQSPALNPIDNPDQAKARQELVLDAMLRDGYISQDQLVAAKYTPLAVRPTVDDRFDIIAPHYALYVRKQLEGMFGAEMVLRGGLQVYTALDLQMQEQAQCVARAHVARLSGVIGNELPADELASCHALPFLPPLSADDAGVDHQLNNAAVVMLDPRTGEIKAMLGSLDYWNEAIDGSFNVAADGLRQPGSSFKPFTYLTALSQGYTPASMTLDVETDFGADYDGIPYVPLNYDRRFHGPMRLRTALGNSYNVPAVEVMSWVGVDNVLRTAHSMGITSLDNGKYGLALTLGGGEVKLLDMAYAFAVMDNMGGMIGQAVPDSQQRFGFRQLDPVAILRVEDRNGNVLYEYNQPQKQNIITPQLAFLMNDMLADRNARCPAFGCPNALELPDNRPAVAKTGTTNDYRDAWTVGYTPQLVTAVWVGNTDNSPMVDVPGSKGAAPIWQALMAWAHQDEPIVGWTRPPGLRERAVCNETGLLPTALCPTVTEYFVEGTEPTIYDNMYQEFRINRETGRLATIYTPPHLIDNRIFRIFPDRAADWVREQEIPQPPTEFDTIIAGAEDAGNNVIIRYPRPFAFARGEIQILGSAKSDDFSHYRLAYFQGLTPNNIVTLRDQVTEQVTNGVLGSWNVANLNGLYTILLTVFNNDGSFEEASIQITVDNVPPIVEIASPFEGQIFAVDDEAINIRAKVEDDVSIAKVSFYAGNAGVPFAISAVPPFTEQWQIAGTGCQSFKAIAEDSAGNQAVSQPVSVCFGE